MKTLPHQTRLLDEQKFYQYLAIFEKILAKYQLSLQDFLKHSRSYNMGSIEFIQKIESRLPPGARLLEVGVGMGLLSFILSVEGFKIFGLEVKNPQEHDPWEINPKREKFKEKVWGKIEKKWGGRFGFFDGRHIPFKNLYFDAIVFDGVFEHIHPKERKKLMQEINRVLKKNGMVFVSRCPNRLALAEFLARLIFGHGHYRIFDKKQLKKIFLKSSFTIESIKTTDFILNFLPGRGIKILNFLFPLLHPLNNLILKTPLSIFAHNFEIVARKGKPSTKTLMRGKITAK